MAKTINKKSTEKRTYKHSDAWLKAHEEKLAKKQLAQKPAKRGRPKKTSSDETDVAKKSVAKVTIKKEAAKRGRPKKTEVKNDVKKPAIKNIAKNAASKKTAIKQKTKKVDNKKVAKKPMKKANDKKLAKKPAKKVDVKKLNSLFEDAKKKNAAIKNTMKQMSEVVSGILADGDQKTYDKLLKKLAFYGFTIVDGTLANTTTTVKVKLPKTKASTVKPSVDPEKPIAEKPIAEKPTDEVTVPDKPGDDAGTENDEGSFPQDDYAAASIPDVEVPDEDQEEHEDEDEAEDEEDDADDPEMEDLDDEEKAQLREDRRMAKEYERGQRAESDDMINDAMRENGDWD